MWAGRCLVVVVAVGCGHSAPSQLDALDSADGSGGTDAVVSGANLAFITSATVAPGALGTVAAADAMCGDLANAAHHPGRFVAWLSTRTSDATTRIPRSTLGWQRSDGQPVAATVDQLVEMASGAQQLWYPLRLDEKGNDLGAAVAFTGTTRIGTTAGGDCGAYGSTSSTDLVGAGRADSGRRWAENAADQACDAPAHFYCFQTDGTIPVAAPVLPSGAKRAFVSATPFVPTSGIAGADALCGGSAVAWLATTTSSANGRITGTGPWYRLDGVEIAPAGPWTGALAAPLELDATGALTTSIASWTGADTPTTVGTTGTCADWTSNSLNGEMTASFDDSIHPFGDTPPNTSGCATSSIALWCVDD